MKTRVQMKAMMSLCVLVIAIDAGRSNTADIEVQAGQKIFADKCSSCHSCEPSRQQDPFELARSEGPSLYYAGTKFKRAWLEKWLVSPQRIRPAGYLPFRYVISTPGGDKVDESALPEHIALSEAEAREVAAFLATLKKEINPYPTSEAKTSISARVHFEKIVGCASCHQAEYHRGGVSGPELYTSSARLEREWVESFIGDPFYWSFIPMPKASIRSDQMAAISDYIFQQPAPESVANAAKPKQDRSQASARPIPTNRVELIYQVFCSQCHGIKGNGKGINASQMFVSPRDHTSFTEMSMLSDERLATVIKFGGPAVGKSVLMPSWGAVLKDSDIGLLVDYLRNLSGTRGAAN